MSTTVERYQALLADAYAWTYMDQWFKTWLKHSASLEGLSRDDLVACMAAAHRIRDITRNQPGLFEVRLEAGPVDG